MAKPKQNKPVREDFHIYLSTETAKKLRSIAQNQCRSTSSQAAFIIERALETEAA